MVVEKEAASGVTGQAEKERRLTPERFWCRLLFGLRTLWWYIFSRIERSFLTLSTGDGGLRWETTRTAEGKRGSGNQNQDFCSKISK